MTNAEVARVFEDLADLLEIKGGDSFKISSYRRVARTLEDLATPLTEIAGRGELLGLSGVGKSSAEKIQELLANGKLALREELLQEIPITLLEVLRIPGTGPKKAALLWRQCGVVSIETLKIAIEQGKLETVKGFGATSIARIREGIEFLSKGVGRTRLGLAWEIAQHFIALVKHMPGVKRVEPAGSLRRGVETIGDIDLLCITNQGSQVVEHFVGLPQVLQVMAAGDTKGSILAQLEGGKTVQIDLRVVPKESFGAAWQYFTGSKAHNVRLRDMALKRGWTLNEYSLSELETGKVVAGKTEEEIYDALGLPCFPPEMREDRGEFDLTSVPQGLVRLEDMRGDLHMHTTASDGRSTIEEMIAAAKALGYKYICITDHSQSSGIANGLKPERLADHIRRVRAIAAKTRGIAVWIGAEADIHPDGRLDYADDLLAQLDWVVGSVHTGQSKDSEQNTQRTIAAMRSPYVNVIAHPTGRLINRRDAMAIDMDAVSRAAAATGTALEINASAYRLDMKDQHARLARERGAKICIDCDAHHTDQFDQMRFGVMTGRRAWLTTDDVVNTWPVQRVREFVEAKRRKAPAEAK